MSEPIFNYRHSSFNLNQAYYYTLLMHINATSFSYGVIYDKQLVAWDTNCSLDELTEPKELAEQLAANYKQIVVGLPANDFTLVPAPLYQTDKVAEYARFLDVKPNEKVLAQQLDNDNFIVYKTPEKIIDGVLKFDLKKTVFAGKGWVTANAKNHPANNELYLNTENNVAEFLMFKDDKIRFYNRFEYRTADDLTYFAAFVADELNMYPRNIKLILSGTIKPDDAYSDRLAEFFQSIVFNSIDLVELPAELKAPQLLPLAALSLCVSSEVL